MLGVGIGLKTTRAYSPSAIDRIAALFANGEQGAWYEPSDLTTLFQDTAGAVPVTAPGQAVARINDKSGNGHNATQATVAARPIYAVRPATGVRNRFISTDDFSNAYWPKQGYTATAPNTIIEDTSTGFHRILATQTATVGNAVTISFTVAPNGRSRVILHFGGPGVVVPFTLVLFDLIAKTSSNPGISTIEDLGDRLRISTTVTAVGTGPFPCGIEMATNSNARSYTGDGVSGIFLYNAQFEIGPVSDYQRVGSTIYDVTEPGVPSVPYLFDDNVDDALLATIPDLGTDATLAFAAGGSTTILTGQTIGAGSFDVLRAAETNAVVVVDRALTAPQTTNLTQYLDNARGA